MSDPILSRKLAQMAELFAGHPEIHMDRLSAGQFAAALGLLAEQARRLEADIDRLTWAIGAARDPQRNADAATMADALRDIKRMLADDPAVADAQSLAAIDAGVRAGQVTLFPRASRPAFSDGGTG
jgi:hypothetical protein